MAPTSEAELSTKDYLDEGISDISPCSSLETTQFLEDFDNSCETFFCRRNSPLLSRSVIPEPSSTFRKVLGDMGNRPDEDDCNADDDGDDEDAREYNTSNSLSSSSLSLSSCSSSVGGSKLSSMSSRKFPSSQSNFLSVPSSLSSYGTPSHADMSDSGAHKTLAGLSLRKNTPRRPASFGGSDAMKPDTTRLSSQREKRVSWADERGTKHQLISVRLIRPRLSMDSAIVVSATPTHSILRRQMQI